MAFYKLFCVLHRRTDWFRLWRLEREYMMPEWYEEREKRAEAAWERLMYPFKIYDECMKERTY